MNACSRLWIPLSATIQHSKAAPSHGPANGFLRDCKQHTQKNISKQLLWAQSPQTTSGVALHHSCSSLSSSSIPAPQLFVSRTSHAVFTRSASLDRHSLNPQCLVVGLLLHLQGNSIHMLSAPDSSLLPAGQAL